MTPKKPSAKSNRKSPARERAKGAARAPKAAQPAKEKLAFRQGVAPQRAPVAEPAPPLPRRAAPKPAAKKTKGPKGHPTASELRELPSEEIWAHYRKAIH